MKITQVTMTKFQMSPSRGSVLEGTGWSLIPSHIRVTGATSAGAVSAQGLLAFVVVAAILICVQAALVKFPTANHVTTRCETTPPLQSSVCSAACKRHHPRNHPTFMLSRVSQVWSFKSNWRTGVRSVPAVQHLLPQIYRLNIVEDLQSSLAGSLRPLCSRCQFDLCPSCTLEFLFAFTTPLVMDC